MHPGITSGTVYSDVIYKVLDWGNHVLSCDSKCNVIYIQC
jgi:hypothetical protein